MSRPQDFWARRRAAVAAEAQAEEAALEAEALARDHAALEQMDEAEVLAALDLPDPDTLSQGDDFSVFMAKAVPDQIRRRALRTLWRSNPVLANVDALVDYGEDFTDSATVVENIQTAYQVGKGMLKHVEEMARQAEESSAPDDAEQDPAPDVLAQTETQAKPELATAHSEAADDTPPKVVLENPAVEEETAPRAPAPRRMKFTTEKTA